MITMRSASLKLFLFLFTLKSFITMGHAYPSTDLYKDDFLEDNSIMKSLNTSKNNAVASITPYICVYIPPELDVCDFISYHKSKKSVRNLERKLSEKKKRKLLRNNKIYFSHSTIRVPEADKFLNKKSVKTIIYEIQRCVPSRLPFTLPWCTDEDLSDKKSEIQRLYPFAINAIPKETYEFPAFLNKF